eukprot:CAMPEP_0174373774 /NCGR_PEP_ID=MMETSP0811_2-20130205/108444_1 /TAXON_ID=73025 ORGANISM="Eutreptiella gymnastica-like, Strain CCMP1594" /NCGR_SAMPLE_ID=MMETSP0811_2 /ASSEMBLY_ACC=CAM_ASM_000667 /LENGTH=300 /DNA_ID=CAMNT_0015522471 /DNA_START=39 /DNA_END=939 /DNA_ORIENTATION=-
MRTQPSNVGGACAAGGWGFSLNFTKGESLSKKPACPPRQGFLSSFIPPSRSSDRQSRERVWRRLLGDLYSLPHSKHKGEKYKRNTKRAALHHAASVKRSSLATSQSSDLSQSMSSHHLSHSYGDPMGASTPSLSRSVNSRGRSRLKPNGTAAPDIMHRLDTEDSLAAPVAVPGAVSQSTSRLNQQVELCLGLTERKTAMPEASLDMSFSGPSTSFAMSSASLAPAADADQGGQRAEAIEQLSFRIEQLKLQFKRKSSDDAHSPPASPGRPAFSPRMGTSPVVGSPRMEAASPRGIGEGVG